MRACGGAAGGARARYRRAGLHGFAVLICALGVGVSAPARAQAQDEQDDEVIVIPEEDDDEVFVVPEEDEDEEDSGSEDSPGAAEDEEDTAELILPEISVEDAIIADAAADEPALHVEAGTEKIDKGELETRQVRQLSDALEWMVSASPMDTASGGTAMIVDGLPAAQVQVTQGGMPVARPVGGPDGPAMDLDAIQISEDTVASITVRRGLGTPGSGPASGVVVEIEPLPQPPGWGAGVRGNMLLIPGRLLGEETGLETPFPPRAMVGANLGYAGKTAGVRVEGSFQNRRGIDVNRDGVSDSADQRQFQLGARGEWRPGGSKQDSLVLNLNYQDMFTEGVYSELSIMRDLIATERLVAQLGGKWQLRPATRLVHTTQFDDYQHRFSKRVMQSGYERLKADTGQLRVTQDVLVEQLYATHLVGAEVYASTERVARTGETGDLPEVDRFDFGLGLSDTWMPTERLQFGGRVWGSLHNEFGPDVMVDLSGQWQVIEALVLRASASRTRRLPTAEELYLFFDHSEVGYQITGNSELKPEQLWSGRAGLDLELVDKRLRLSLDGYYHRLNDLIATQIDTSHPGRIAQYSYINVDRAQTAGLNAGLHARDLLWGAGARVSYSWLPLAENIDTGARLSLRTYHQLLIELSRKWLGDELETSAYLRARSSLETPSDTPNAPAYTILGLRATLKPVAGLRLGLNADNLLNQTNATWGPKEGFSVLVHAAYQFAADEDTDQTPPPSAP